LNDKLVFGRNFKYDSRLYDYSNTMTNKELHLDGLTGPLGGLEMGSETGVPLLCVHGWLDNAASFIPLARQLNQFRWLCVDLPGHGSSAHRPEGSIYHFTDYIADLYRAFDSLGMEKCDLVGHSLGAGIVAAFAATFPQKVNRLVLIDGIGPVSGKDDDSLAQLRKSMSFLEDDADMGPRFYLSWDALVKKRMNAGNIDTASVETLLGRGAVREGGSATVISDGRLKHHSPIYMSQKKVLSILGGIEARTLLIIADKGIISDRQSTTDRIAAIKNLHTVTVPGRHHVHLDDAAAVALEMDRFLDNGEGA
jgi:pimeloyl-ACP methyl ester carboxylesterase